MSVVALAQARSRQRIRLRVLLEPAILLAFVLWLARAVIGEQGVPWGVDTYLHLARVWYMADVVRATASLPQWFPYWYNGTPLEQYYPPLAGYLMLPLQLLFDNIILTYRVFLVTSMAAAALGAYWTLRQWTTPAWAALGAALYLATPYEYTVVFQDGNASRMVLIVLMPLLLGFTVKLLEDGRRLSFLKVSVTTCLLILAHHQQGAMVLAVLGVVCLGHLGRDGAARLRVMLAIAAMGLGVMLSSWWLLPGLLQIDYATVPDVSLLPERLWIYSITTGVFNPIGRTTSSVAPFYVGSTLLMLGTLSVVLRRTRFKLAVYGAMLLSIFLAFGVNLPIYERLPLATALFPERFLMFGVLLMVVLIADFARICQKLSFRRWMRFALLAAIALIAIWDFSPWWGLSRMASYAHIQGGLANLPARDDGSRLVTRATGMNSEWAYFPLIWSGYPLAYGWSVETTPHSPTFAQINLALRNGRMDFIRRIYANWNVRAAIITSDDQQLATALADAGFKREGQLGDDILLSSDAPSTPLMNVQSNGIVIGRGAYATTMIFPWFTYGTSWNVEDYDPAYLEHFNLIYLYDFRFNDYHNVEAMVRHWLSEGKTVVMNLTGTPDTYLFGVETKTIEVPVEPEFHVGPDVDFHVDGIAAEPFEFEERRWRGMSYYDLDGTLVNVVDNEGGLWPVMGFKDLAEGRAYFVGLNWITHIMLTNDQASIGFLQRFFERARPQEAFAQPNFPIKQMQRPADKWGFTYQSKDDGLVMVSETWSAHWRATLDGMPLPIYNHENLISFYLPAGDHTVDLQYVSTPIQWVGRGISLLFAIVLGFIWLQYSRLAEWYRWCENRFREATWG